VSCKCGFFVGSGPVEDPGTCVLKNQRSESSAEKYAQDLDLCTQQAEGNFQLSFSPEPPLIHLYDSACREVAWYRPDLAPMDCGVPFKIDYFGDDKPIVITEMVDSVADTAFTFELNGRSYGMEDEWCGGCNTETISESLGEQTQCKCGFYVGT